MADSASPPSPAPVRRGPPPLPRASGESTPVTAPPAEAAPVEELLKMVVAEAEATDAKRRAADLRVRAALLAWDGGGDGDRAIALVDKIEHPIAPTLRLAAALLARDDAALQECVAEAKK